MRTDVRSYSLYELLASVRRCIEASYIGAYWVRAEASGVNVNPRSGHCYLELEDKSEESGSKARVKANIWRQNFEFIANKLRQAGLQPLSSGMSILCKVQLSFHEVYGLSLIILDIDTSYSLGEIARQKQATILKLKNDGVWNSNKEHLFPELSQRFAIISSPTAAGYEDFLHQLRDNPYNLKYYTALFTAQMQGEKTTESVIAALNRISQHLDEFDAVIIIRGGGSVSDLRAFDDYTLCYYCTQYPLPIIAGIGHDRDVSVLDMIAHTSLKTPTAVAEFLIKQQYQVLQSQNTIQQNLFQATFLYQTEMDKKLKEQAMRLPHLTLRRINLELQRQNQLREALSLQTRASISTQQVKILNNINALSFVIRSYKQTQKLTIETQISRLCMPIHRHLSSHLSKIETFEKIISLAHPKNILKKGFAIIESNGKILNAHSRLSQGDKISLRLGNQHASATIEVVAGN